MEKSFAVIGLGKFGRSVAIELANTGADVLAVDIDKERVHSVADLVTCAVAVDVRDTEAMDTLGLSNMDAVVIAITEKLDISILATIYAKDAGVSTVVCKAQDETHKKILEKIGADQTIMPEHETGIRLARRLSNRRVINFMEISDKLKMVEIDVKPNWIGKSLMELDLRKKENLNVIAVRKDASSEYEVNPSPDIKLTDSMTILITCDVKDLDNLL
ncbi:TrkA family potassium uptake protein [Eubacterium sp. MSJ-13]|uniref:potassium channel family protein n=1 Tax=Eubacterium sp. MSJ-13 TaxID=2841513 RepID=UPI001C1289F3|nr:TrkA family potassium uptake protein [Eubacterium sp. MSJ-13]MBU5478889.1 TrkA family potassium uptake protein [Eubacterium sp. MSJ-13]